ncbi:MAG: hypothetical protein ACOH1T_10950 [Microbacteriaceae bacterium]
MSTHTRCAAATAAALTAALLVVGLAACADRGRPADPPATTEPSSDATGEPGASATVEVMGAIQALSSGSADGVYVLRMTGGGYLSIAVPDGESAPVRQAGVVIAVPADFDRSLSGEELYAALFALSESTGEPLTVVEFLEITPR